MWYVPFVTRNWYIASYTDGDTPCKTSETPSEVVSDVKLAADRIYKNAIKGNQGKCHLFAILDPIIYHWRWKIMIKNTKSQKLLGITIDKKVTFDEHVSNLCDKASRKINALARLFPCMPLNQRRTLMNAYSIS